MKITKSQLKRIIKEELKIAIKENDDWYDDERGYETVADRKFADQQPQRPYRTGVPDEDVLKHGGDFEKYPETPEELESDRIANELDQEYLAQPGNTEKDLRWVDEEILDMAMAVRDGDMDMEVAKQAVRDGVDAMKDAIAKANERFTEGKADPGQKKSTKEWGKKERKKEGGKYRAASKKETEKMKKQARGGQELDEIIQEMVDEVVDKELNEKCKGSGCATPQEVADYGDDIDKGAKNRKKIKNPYAVAWKVAKEKGSVKGPQIAGRVPGYKKGK